MRKVAVIGGGNVGATAAWQIASKDLADVALYDILPGVPAGKALDMSQAGEVFHFDARIEGSDKIEVIRGAEVVVVTAGFPRKPRTGRGQTAGWDTVVAGLRLNGVTDKTTLAGRAEASLRAANLWEEVKDRLDKPGAGLFGG